MGVVGPVRFNVRTYTLYGSTHYMVNVSHICKGFLILHSQTFSSFGPGRVWFGVSRNESSLCKTHYVTHMRKMNELEKMEKCHEPQADFVGPKKKKQATGCRADPNINVYVYVKPSKTYLLYDIYIHIM